MKNTWILALLFSSLAFANNDSENPMRQLACHGQVSPKSTLKVNVDFAKPVTFVISSHSAEGGTALQYLVTSYFPEMIGLHVYGKKDLRPSGGSLLEAKLHVKTIDRNTDGSYPSSLELITVADGAEKVNEKIRLSCHVIY